MTQKMVRKIYKKIEQYHLKVFKKTWSKSPKIEKQQRIIYKRRSNIDLLKSELSKHQKNNKKRINSIYKKTSF